MSLDPSLLPKSVPFTKRWQAKPYPAISAAGRKIVVTGGGTGIGNAVAVSFAQAGASSITILGRRSEQLNIRVAAIQAAAVESSHPDTQVFCQTADLASRDETTKAFAAIAGKIPGGKIDVLVSNAGPPPIINTIADATDEQFLNSFRGQVMTAMHAVQAFLPLAGPDPILLSTNTCFAHWSAVPYVGLYAFSRAALFKLMASIQGGIT